MVKLNGEMMETEENGSDKYKVSIERTNVPVSDISRKMYMAVSNNLRQFASAYTARLAELSKILKKKAKDKWNKPVVSLADLENFHGDSCIIIGTLYKHQQWKPSILRELCEDDQFILTDPKPDYCDESDQLFLEDDTARIRLISDKVNLNSLVTGVVAAILGNENESSKFEVKDVCFPGCPLQTKIRSTTTGKLVLLSGLNISETCDKLPIQLLKEWLDGFSGNVQDQENLADIAQVIIAGNGKPKEKKTDEPINYNSSSANNAGLMKSLEKLDDFISELAANCYVTFMPGSGDATSIMLPQKQLHPCLLPKSRNYKSFARACNPLVCRIGTRVITGSCGQPIRDIAKATGGEASITHLEETLNWRHLCPTSPDTLPSYPCFENGDVMIMKECPDVYFVGDMAKFETKLWTGDDGQKVRLICLPNFCDSQAAVIVDLESLDAEVMTFGFQ